SGLVQVLPDGALDGDVHVRDQVAVGLLSEGAGVAGGDEVAGDVGGGMGDGQELVRVGGHSGVLRLARASQTCSKTGYRLPGSSPGRMSRVGDSTPRAWGR